MPPRRRSWNPGPARAGPLTMMRCRSLVPRAEALRNFATSRGPEKGKSSIFVVSTRVRVRSSLM
eukprot:1588777-Pyramimonas_sp.AAC.1